MFDLTRVNVQTDPCYRTRFIINNDDTYRGDDEDEPSASWEVPPATGPGLSAPDTEYHLHGAVMCGEIPGW